MTIAGLMNKCPIVESCRVQLLTREAVKCQPLSVQ